MPKSAGQGRLKQTRAICAALVLGLSLTGCAGMPGFSGMFDKSSGMFSDGDSVAESAPAPAPDIAVEGARLPTYRVGDAYTFGNPPVRWEVVSIDGDRVTWRSENDDEQVTGFNPLLPAREWRSNRLGEGYRIISHVKGHLFPMKVGSRTAFKY